MSIILILLFNTVEPIQDPDNTCYLNNTCIPTGSIDNPFS